MKRRRKLGRKVSPGFKWKVVRAFVGFLIFMFVCSTVSRGIYAYRMPQVKVASAESGMLSHKLEIEGKLEAVSEKAVLTVPGIRVGAVYVGEGQPVKKGVVLFQLDVSDLKEKIAEMDEEIGEMERALQSQEKQRQSQKRQQEEREQRTRSRQIERQKQDLQTMASDLGKQVKKAEEEYKAAAEKVTSYPSWEQFFSDAKEGSSEYLTLKSAAEKKGATQEEREAYTIFMKTFQSSMKKEWQQEREARKKARQAAEEALESARQNKTDTLDRQKEQNRRENEDARDQTADSLLDNDGAEIEIKKNIAKIRVSKEKYEKLLRRDGKVKCEKAGVVKQVGVSVGERTPDGVAVLCSDAGGGYRFSANITEEQKKYLDAVEEVDLSFQGGKVTREGMSVTSIQNSSDGGYIVNVEVKDKQVTQGERGIMEVSAESARHDCYIPISGLYAGGTDYYVLVLQEEETFLGTEYSVEKRKVDVSDKNDEYAALKGTPVGNEDKIVISSDREIRAGDQVRMLEDDE